MEILQCSLRLKQEETRTQEIFHLNAEKHLWQQNKGIKNQTVARTSPIESSCMFKKCPQNVLFSSTL